MRRSRDSRRHIHSRRGRLDIVLLRLSLLLRRRRCRLLLRDRELLHGPRQHLNRLHLRCMRSLQSLHVVQQRPHGGIVARR